MTIKKTLKGKKAKITNIKDKNELLSDINEITLSEDLSNIQTINKINKLKDEISKLDELDSNKLDAKNNKYYQTMSATYIDDNGKISEVYRINEEIVTKEIYDEWSYDYFHVTKLLREKEEEEKLKNDIISLEEELNAKKDLFLKKTNSNNTKLNDTMGLRSSRSANLFRPNYSTKNK